MEILKKASLFWDVKEVNPEKNKKFVIERILQYGDEADFSWALNYYGRDEIVENMLKSRALDRKSLSFWCQFFNLDQEKCTAMLFMKTPGAFLKR